MKIGIMQPYFLPYIGYWQLINAVDQFVIYDNIQFSKKGWINRNRILVNGSDSLFSLPLKKDSDYLDVKDRTLSDSFDIEKLKLIRRIESAYAKAPLFKNVLPTIEKCFSCDERNLFGFIYNSILTISEYLQINTPKIISSNIEMDHSLKNKDRVIATCKALKADTYINPIGGQSLYNKLDFSQEGIELYFIQSSPIRYKQYNDVFVGSLSIIDVMMFNSAEAIREMLNMYDLI